MRKTAARLLSKKDRQAADDGDRTRLRALVSGGLTPTVAQRIIGGEVTVTAMPYLEEAYALDEDDSTWQDAAAEKARQEREDAALARRLQAQDDDVHGRLMARGAASLRNSYPGIL